MKEIIEVRNYKIWSPEDLDDLWDNYYYYRNGNKEEAVLSFGCTWKAIETKAQRIGITKMNSGKQHNSACGLDYFKKIDNSDKAYWIGFICADGYIYKDSKQAFFRVCLSSVDKLHLYKLAPIFNKNVRDYSHFDKRTDKTYYMSCLTVFGNEIYTNILYLKEDVVSLLDCISPLYKKDFIRGFFDGDGTVYIDNLELIHFGFCSQDYVFLNRIMNIVCSNTNLNKVKICKVGDKNCYEFRWHGSDIAVYFYDYLYNNANLFLERKRNVFIDFFIRRGIRGMI